MRGPFGGGFYGGRPSGFNGNFGALVPGLTQYMRADLGLHTTGAVVNSWDNQSGAASAMVERTALAGVGSVGLLVGGRASITQNGTTQAATFTLAMPAPATTPTFIYLISKQAITSLPGAPQRILSTVGTNEFLLYQDASSDTLRMYGTTGFKDVVPGITHVWARTAMLFTGSVNDRIKWGNYALATGTNTQTMAASTTARSWGYNDANAIFNTDSCALMLHGNGVTPANWTATLAALDAATASWFSGAILI